MAFGLRRIHNNRPASLDGREWNIFGDLSFTQGRAAHPLAPRGSTATEILRAKATEKTAAAAAADPSLPGGAHSSRGPRQGGSRGGCAQQQQRAAVVRRWSRVASEPSLMNQMCPGVVEREAAKDRAAAPSLAAAAEKKRRSKAAAGNEPYWTASGDLYSPELRQPTFPVAKFHYHAESHTKRDPSQDAGQALTRTLPEGFLPKSSDELVVE
eukprot:CAMPEP_0115528052 /NCGR_PEP_ID=MMETSP0271-20121206/83186_1 /TAXON_ID=71861 /ORGANISM="Scrippsiella trochoidea, Strain CCMP3099" /LENGTH=211 /DNA_ID=CAMNT_0002959949 /DNA_START=36 /DNA_END=668 /DNA_ORIENTATION=-